MAGVALVVEVALALGVVGFVGYPLLKEQWVDDEPEEMPEALDELYSRKESTYSALKELEFDYKTGKLSDADYHELDVRFRAEAVEILEAIEEEEQPAPKRAESAPRAPAAAAPVPGRGGEAVPGGTAVVAAPGKGGRGRSETGPGEHVTCPVCGWQNPASARFCGSCGNPLAAVAAVPTNGGGASSDACVACGGVLKAGQRFCGGCGAEVRA